MLIMNGFERLDRHGGIRVCRKAATRRMPSKAHSESERSDGRQMPQTSYC